MVTFRTSGVWGAGKGSDLTAAEVDNNFWQLMLAIKEMDDNPPTADSISNITVKGGQMRIMMQGGRVFGPFTIPRSIINFRGYWSPSTVYYLNDIFVHASYGVYICNTSFTSPVTFNPTPVGDPFSLMIPVVTPDSAPTVNVLDEAPSPRILTPGDANKYFRSKRTVPIVFHCLRYVDQAIPVNKEYHFRQTTPAKVSFAAGHADVTINVPDGFLPELAGIGATATLKKVGADEWDLFGSLAYVPLEA